MYKQYETRNINLCAAFISKGVPLSSFHKENGITTFVFEHVLDCIEYEKLFMINELEVKAFEYSQALKQLKNIVYSGGNTA